MVIEVLHGDWFVHGAQCYTGRALVVKYPMGLEPVVDTYSPVVRNLLLNSYRNLVELGRRIEMSEVVVLNDTAELFQGLITINSLVIEIERKVR